MCILATFPEDEISDYLARGSPIQVLTVGHFLLADRRMAYLFQHLLNRLALYPKDNLTAYTGPALAGISAS